MLGARPTIQIGDEKTNWERQPMKYPAGIFPHDPIQVQPWLAVLRRSVITGAVSCEGKPTAGHDVGRCSNISWSGSVCQVVGASNLMRGTPRWKEQRAVTDYRGRL